MQDAEKTTTRPASPSWILAKWHPARPGRPLTKHSHGLVCYMPPPSCPSIPAASPAAADHHSPWRLSPHAVLPSGSVYGLDDSSPRPSLSSRMGWQHGCFRDCSLARAAVVLLLRPHLPSPPPRLHVCLSADPVRLVNYPALTLNSLSLSLFTSYSLTLHSSMSHPYTWWLLLSHHPSLVLQLEGLEASSSAGELQRPWWEGEPLSFFSLSSPSYRSP